MPCVCRPNRSTRWKVCGHLSSGSLMGFIIIGLSSPCNRSLNRVLFRIKRISKADRPLTTWERINELLGQCLTARTTYKQLVRGEAKGIELIHVYNSLIFLWIGFTAEVF